MQEIVPKKAVIGNFPKFKGVLKGLLRFGFMNLK
jgi:hypothetical protein